MTLNGSALLFAALGCGLVLAPAPGIRAQQTNSSPALTQPAGSQNQEPDPLKRERTDKEKFTAQKAVKQEISHAYKTWLEQDVAYIISDEERAAFKNLSNDEEREAFIENVWLRRNPSPDSPENEFREEHYRRIAYANEHFAAGRAGWRTDRGHIYIAYGPADTIDDHPSGGTYHRPFEEGGGDTVTYPFEIWHYRHLEGIGDDVQLEFVDTCQCGDYHFTIDRGEKDALQHSPTLGKTDWERLGSGKRQDRDTQGIERLGLGPTNSTPSQAKQFDRLELAAKIFAPPPIKFADLESFISEHKLLSGPVFPFDVRTDYVKVTDNMVLVPITLQLRNRDITFVTKEGVSKGVVNVLGKVTTITHKTVQTFEDTVQVEEPAELLEKSLDQLSVYWKALPLPPDHYRLDIAIKDVNNPDHMGYYGRSLEVPAYHDEKVATSSLILADQMYTVSSHEIGGGNFVLGNTYVRPRVSSPNPSAPVKFKRSQQLNFWMQVYNLGIAEATKSSSATVTYQVSKTVAATASTPASDTVVFEKQMDSKDLGAHSDQMTVEKSLSIAGLEPGKYKVTIKINDAISKQEIAQSAPFVVE